MSGDPNQEEESFSFQNEVKHFIDNQFIKEVKFEDNTGIECKVTFVTLEGTSLECNWSTSNGLKVLNSDHPSFAQT